MKYLCIIILLLCNQSIMADDIKVDYKNSDRLKIIALHEKPDEISISDTQKTTLKLIFDINNVTIITVHDLNIKNEKCQTEKMPSNEIFFLSIPKTGTNKKSITARVNVPCTVNGIVRLKLYVQAKNKIYSKITTLKAWYSNYPNVFAID